MNEPSIITDFRVFLTELEKSVPSVVSSGSVWVGDVASIMPPGVYRVVDGALYKILGLDFDASHEPVEQVTGKC